MSSYVISVSFAKGNYRHIKIGDSSTLYQLHRIINESFGLDDDHMHAFFMDDKYWSRNNAYFSERMEYGDKVSKNAKLYRLGLEPGTKFKYLFDFGDEWRFQCKVLRVSDDSVTKPVVIKSVGEKLEQYPEYDEDDFYDDVEFISEDEEVSGDGEIIPFEPPVQDIEFEMDEEEIDELESLVNIGASVRINDYLDAASKLYGLINLRSLYDIYCMQNEPVSEKHFAVISHVASDCSELWQLIKLGEEEDAPSTLDNTFLAEGSLLDADNDEEIAENLAELLEAQSGRTFKLFTRDEYEKYADPIYFPKTAARTNMLNFLKRKKKNLMFTPKQFCYCLQSSISIGAGIDDIFDIVVKYELNLNGRNEELEFKGLLKELSMHTPIHALCGYTCSELLSAEKAEPPTHIEGQFDLFGDDRDM